jgi:hypothetical protein
MKMVLDGTGILSGEFDTEEIEKRAEAERKRDQAVAERLAQQEDLKSRLETTIGNYLKNEIAEELEAQKKLEAGSKDKRSRSDFLRFREHCLGLGLPALPAAPATVAAFLTSELDQGRPHLRRLIKSISTTHLRCDLHDPTNDLLLKALLRLASDGPSQQTDQPSKGN